MKGLVRACVLGLLAILVLASSENRGRGFNYASKSLGCPNRDLVLTFTYSNGKGEHRHRTQNVTRYAFLMRDGTGFTPLGLDDLLDSINHVQHIHSIAFLLWIQEMNLEVRMGILEAVVEIPIVEESSHLVANLMHLAILNKELENTKNTTLNLESGDFVHQLVGLPEEDINRFAISKSLIRHAFDKYAIGIGGGRRAGLPDFLYLQMNIKDLLNGINSGDSDAVAYAAFLLVGQFMDNLANLKFVGSASVLFTALGGSFSMAVSLYGVMNDITTLVNGNLNGLETAIAITSLINNVVSIVLTAIGMVFAPVGAIGMVLAVVMNLVLAIMKEINADNLAKAHVMQLGTFITLSQAEKDRAYQNHRDGESVDPYLDGLINKTIWNMNLVNSYMSFLEENTAFERVIVSAIERMEARDKPVYYKDNEADLRTRKVFRAERWGPQIMVIDKDGYFKERVICTPKDTVGDAVWEDEVNNYECKYAIGVTDTYQRSNNLTLFLLRDGNDMAYGTTDYTNIFMVEGGDKNFTGGSQSDAFFIQSDAISGNLVGGSGKDTLKLSEANLTSGVVTVDLNVGRMDFSSTGKSIGVSDFEIIQGREGKPDKIVPTCSTLLIDGLGGGGSSRDKIEVPSLTCDFDLSIVIYALTQVINEGQEGLFYYTVNSTMLDANAIIKIKDGIQSQHYILMDSPIDDIRNISCHAELDDVTVYSENGITFVSSFVYGNETTGYYEPTIVFPNDTLVRVNSDRIVTTTFTLNTPNPTGRLRAPPFGQAQFLLNTTYGLLLGGSGDDLFLLSGQSYAETLNGQSGVNKLILSDTFYPGSSVEIDMSAEFIRVEDKEMKALNMAQLLGREGMAEHVIIGCGETYVDGQGGGDLIEVLIFSCPERTSLIRLRNDTTVRNSALEGSFMYFVSFELNTHLEFAFRKNLNHTFQFDVNLDRIKNVSINSQTRQIEFESTIPSEPNLSLPLTTLDSEDSTDLFFTQPTFITNNSVILKAGRDGVVTAVFSIAEKGAHIQGSIFGPNVFLIRADVAAVSGGDFDDVFLLYNETAAELNGGGGKDKFVIDESYKAGEPIVIDFRSGRLFSQDKYESQDITFTDMEEFVGRNKSADHVIASCALSSIDGLGGDPESGENDLIEIPDSECGGYDLLVFVRDNQEMILGDLSSIDNITYFIQTAGGGSFDFTESLANQIVIIPRNYSRFRDISFSNDTDEIHFETANETYWFKVKRNESEDAASGAFHLTPRILSMDFVDFKVSNLGDITAIISARSNQTEGIERLNNIFIVSEGELRNVAGGSGNDTFLLSNASAYGTFDGKGGVNTLRLSQDMEGPIKIGDLLSYRNISYIFGRNGSQDIITVDCNVGLVDSSGGVDSAFQDLLIIPDLNCTYNLNVIIREFTVVENNSPNGSFFYTLMGDEDSESAVLGSSGRFEIFCTNCTNYTTSHTIALTYSSDVISHLVADNETCELNLYTMDDTVRTFALSGSDPCEYPRLLFFDGLLLETSRIGVLRINYRANHSNVEELVGMYKSKAIQWSASIMILTEDERLITIGSPDLDLLQNNPDAESHLIGNGGDNIYVLNQRNASDILAPVFIYLEPDNENGTEIVDLNQLVRPIREKAEAENMTFLYVPDLQVDTRDDSLHILVRDEGVLLSEIQFHGWRDANMRFLLGSNYMELNNTGGDDQWTLSPIPYNFSTVVHAILDQADMEDNTLITIDKSLRIGNNTFTRSGNDLVLTNTLNMSTEEGGAFTMVFKSYLDTGIRQNKFLPRGITLEFEDVTLDLDTIVDDISTLISIEDAQEAVRIEIEKEVFTFQCRDEGLHPHPVFCDKYYRCAKIKEQLVPIELPCPRDTIFCPDTLTCNAESADCQCRPYLEG